MDEQDRELERLLGEARVPPSDRARTEAVTAARGLVDPPVKSRGFAFRIAAAAVILLAAISLTPPGRAAAEWFGELVGVGEVGGPPTESSQVGDFNPDSEELVLAAGEAADGTPFEIIAYRSDVPLGEKGPTVCVNADLIGDTAVGGAACYSGALRFKGLCCTTSSFSPRQPGSFRVQGSISPEVARVSVRYLNSSGANQTAEAAIGMITPEFAKRLEIDNPSGIFVVSLPDVAEESGLPKPLTSTAEPVQVTAFDADGNELGTESTGKVPQDLLDLVEERRDYELERK